MITFRWVLLALMLGLAAGRAAATAQIPDQISFDGQTAALYAQPIQPLLSARPDLKKKVDRYIKGGCSASWSGLRASWEIRDDQLYLVKLEANPCADPKDVPLRKLGAARGADRLLADWYSGQLRVPQGAEIEYVHMGFESQYERDLILTVEKGRIVGREVRENPLLQRPPPEPQYPPEPAPES
ncbi:hypothetical protein [Arenimonas sp.]|uniref:hypothetical protein n=1 Tax=Arenimonas sp. TaxID=1872635 RepID=UPI002E308DEB|nr:hypothetical protein [Arenimonas sp.]HEX4852896.1 hypothetical protein [Arenimonas sp.]